MPPEELALFVSTRRRRWSVRAVQDLVKHLGVRAGTSRPVTPHLLRHSSATEYAELGTPISVVQEICGHASVTTTQRYIHVNGGQRRRALEALGERWQAKEGQGRPHAKKALNRAPKPVQPTA